MCLLKTFTKNKSFFRLLRLVFFMLFTFGSCKSCEKYKNSGDYVSNAKGNIAGIKVDKSKLVGNDKNFTLSFTMKNDSVPINLSNYGIHASVVNGEISYTHFSREGKDEKLNKKTKAFSLGVPLFFEKVKFTPDEVRDNKVTIPFTIVPQSGKDNTDLFITLVKKGKKGEKDIGEVRINWLKNNP